MNMINKNKILLLSMLLAIASTTMAMERPVVKPQEQTLIEQLSQAARANDFERYFALLNLQPIAKQKELCNERLTKEGERAVHFAAGNGNNEALKRLLELGAQVSIFTFPRNVTPLMYAASRKGNVQTVAILIAHGANKFASNSRGELALHCAAASGNTLVMLSLIKDHGVDVNSMAMRCTPLCSAAESGQIEALTILIAHGAEKDREQDCRSQTALHYAARSGKTAMVVVLITNHGFNPNAKSIYGLTPMHLAIQAGKYETFNALIQNGGKMDVDVLYQAVLINNASVLAALIKEHNINIYHNMNSALGWAFQSSNCLAKFTLQSIGAEFTEQEEHYKNFPKGCLFQLKTETDKQTILDSLSKGSLAPWDPNDMKSTDQSTALIEAVKNNCASCVAFLLNDIRTNPNTQDIEKKTALHYAVELWKEYGVIADFKIVRRLLNLQRTNVAIENSLGKKARDLITDEDVSQRALLFSHNRSLAYLIKLFDLRKMRVQLYFSLKNARCSVQCQEQTCTHGAHLPADICLKIARLLTEDFLPVQEVKNDQDTTETTSPAPTIAGSAIIGQLYSMCKGFLGQRQ